MPRNARVTVRLERDKASAAAEMEKRSGDDLRGIGNSYCGDGDPVRNLKIFSGGLVVR
jgi:hypothetical protein